MTARRLAVSWFLVLVACSSTDDAAGGAALSDSAGLAIGGAAPGSGMPTCEVAEEPTVTIGMAEGPSEYQFYRTFGQRRLSDGRIAVVNQGSQELRFYDAEGRFINASGGSGEGPGEFTRAFTLRALPGDSLWVGDYRPWSWEVFGSDGRWVRAAAPSPPYPNTTLTGVLDDGRMVVGAVSYVDVPINRFEPAKLVVVLHARDGTVIDTIGEYENGLQGRFDDVPNLVVSPMFDSSARVAVGGSRVIVGHTSQAELRVYEVEDSLRLDRVIRWEAPERPVTESDVAAEKKRVTDQLADVDPAVRGELLDPQIREDRPVAETFPVYSTLELGRDGRIWVRAYRTPGHSGNDEWLIFTAEGELQCRVSMESFAQMPDFGSDYILVMRRDELDVERIHQYALSGPIPAGAAPAKE